MRAGWQKGTLPLLLFGRSSGSLGSLGLGHPLLEFVHASGRVYELLLAGIEGMTGIADTNNNHRFSGARLDDVAASATNFRLHIFGMNLRSHKNQGRLR